MFGVGDGVTDRDLGDPCDGHDLTGPASSAMSRSSTPATKSSVIFTVSIEPSWRHQATGEPFFSDPCRIRQTASLPRYGEASRLHTSGLKWCGRVVHRRRDVVDHGVEEGCQVGAHVILRLRCQPARAFA